MNRDDEAIRRLMGPPSPARRKELERAVQELMDREGLAGCCRTSRIWTRRDERRVNMLRGLSGGRWPQCRSARYLVRLQPQSSASPHNHWFRLAVDEAWRDGTAAVLSPKLEQTKAIYERLITAARSVTQDDGGRSDFDSARRELSSRVCELMNWTKPTKSQLVAGPDVNAPVVAGNAAHREDEAGETPSRSDTAHSPDFRSVKWFGVLYSFTSNQASVVRLLLENWEAGTPDVGDETLLLAVDPEAPPARLAVLFRDHPAWTTMIVMGDTKGTRRLDSPKGK